MSFRVRPLSKESHSAPKILLLMVTPKTAIDVGQLEMVSQRRVIVKPVGKAWRKP